MEIYMQMDMHYYAVFFLAAAAGMKISAAHTVANCSQFVDDSDSYDLVSFSDGSSCAASVTAHHTLSVKNLDVVDQRFIWVPFHFLPGGTGESIEEKLVCAKNSFIVRMMLDEVLSAENIKSSDFISRVGISAHVLADTFSHSGFSGISSDLNRVVSSSIDMEITDMSVKKEFLRQNNKFFRRNGIIKSFIREIIERIQGKLAESVTKALGHGSVATCPDVPYLRWKFKYEKPEREVCRNNPQEYRQACEALYLFFCECCSLNPEITENAGIPYQNLVREIESNTAYEGDCEKRSGKWMKSALNMPNRFLNGTVPEYKGEVWKKCGVKSGYADAANEADRKEAASFHRAAEAHRNFILRSVLPAAGIRIV